MKRVEGFPVNFVSEAKNKTIVLERSKINKIFFNNAPKNCFSKIVNEIKEMAIEDAKISVANFSIIDCFENPKKIIEKLNEIVFYSHNFYEDTRYDNFSTDLFKENLLSGISHVNLEYLKKNEEKLLYRLKGKNII